MRLLSVSAKISNFLFEVVGFQLLYFQVQCTCSVAFYLFDVVMSQGALYLFSNIIVMTLILGGNLSWILLLKFKSLKVCLKQWKVIKWNSSFVHISLQKYLSYKRIDIMITSGAFKILYLEGQAQFSNFCPRSLNRIAKI